MLFKLRNDDNVENLKERPWKKKMNHRVGPISFVLTQLFGLANLTIILTYSK